MKVKSYLKVLAFVVSAFVQTAKAQCTDCSTLISSNDITTYSVGVGQSLCIANNFNYTGTISLQGGTLCNTGTITTINFYSGIFNNYGTYKTPSGLDITFELTGKLKINSYTGSKFEIKKNLTINSAGNDSVNVSIHEGGGLSVSNSFSLNSGKAKITIGLPATSGTNTSFITALNINGNMIVKPNVNILVTESGFLNVMGNLTLSDEGVKEINNYGNVTVNGLISVAGNGQNTSTVTIDNYASFFVYDSFNSDIVNAKVLVTNHGNENAKIYVAGNMTLAQETNTLTNSGDLRISGDLNLTNGKFINHLILSARDLKVESGVFTNNWKTDVSRDLLITATVGVVHNNKVMFIANNFNNKGTVNLAKQSVIRTLHFNNELSASTISGPTNLLDQNNNNDIKNIARIIIDESSYNYGVLTNHILLVDMTYSGESETRIDMLGEFSTIGGNVSYALDCAFSLPVGFLYAAPPGGTPKATFCPGQNVVLSLFPYVTVLSGPSWSVTGGFGGINTSWPNLNSPTITSIQSDCTVTAWGTYFNGVTSCAFISQMIIPVSNASITATPPIVYFGTGNPVVLTTTVANVVGPQFTWTPNAFFVPPSNNHVQNPAVDPQVSFTYTVNVADLFGCAASTTVLVIGEPFALLDKELNGEHYLLSNNKLFFKHDGQYDNTTFVYRVYDKTHALIASNPPVAPSTNLVNISTVKPGDNRYTLDASSLTAGAYVLEVLNEKKERLYLRFKK